MAGKTVEIAAEQELRVEVEDSSNAQTLLPATASEVTAAAAAATTTTTTTKGVTVTLREGTCECFGTELALQQPYTFVSGSKLALFSWHGCRLFLEGSCRSYVAEKTPMPSYLMMHEKLEETRALAGKNASIPGPVIVIVGPVDSGKSSLARMLLGWAVRAGHKPFFADLDVGQGTITVPGTVAAIAMDKPPSVVEGIAACRSAPIVLNYGHVSLDRNPALFRALVENLDAVIREKMESDPIAKRSGTIVNTCGWIEGLGYDLLIHVIKAMRADVVAVIDNERLFHFLTNDLKDRPEIDVQLLQKSGGVVNRDNDYRRKARLSRIREYFYGPAGDFCPHSSVLNFSDVRIFRLGGTPAPTSTLPIGQAPQFDPLCAMEVSPSLELGHSVLAVVYCDDPSEILQANVAGFIYISKVEMDKKTLTILSPCPGQLPSKLLIVGSIKWLE